MIIETETLTEAYSTYLSASYGAVGVTGFVKSTSVLHATDEKVILKFFPASLELLGSKVTAKYDGSQVSSSLGMMVLYFNALSKSHEL